MAEGTDQVRVDGGVVVGDDGSECSARALRFAVEEARRRGSALHVVRGWLISNAARPTGVPYGSVPSLKELAAATEEALTERLSEMLPGEHDLDLHTHVPHAPAARALLGAADGADVLVVGSRGRGGFRALLLGSTAEQVVRHSPCPVIVVKR